MSLSKLSLVRGKTAIRSVSTGRPPIYVVLVGKNIFAEIMRTKVGKQRILYLLARSVEVPVTPQLLHHLLLLGAELSRVDLGELLEGEAPLVEARPEGNGALVWVNLCIQVHGAKIGRGAKTKIKNSSTSTQRVHKILKQINEVGNLGGQQQLRFLFECNG